MQHTLEQQAQNHSNDYSSLEPIYRDVTGGELVMDPYASVRYPAANLTLSASVIIPAWNAHGTLEQCLISIEQSSFNCRYPGKLEVIVVDDGSTDGTWELLERLRLGINLKVIRQAHHSRAHTQNTGIAFASGDVIISCDADMILTPFSIEELVKRHQVFDNVMLLGFRGDIQPADPRIQPAVLAEHLPHFLPPFTQDVRMYYSGGWPESMCRDSDHLKRLGQGKHIIMPDGSKWNLPGIVYGALFSMRRHDLVSMDGYDERFYGWGCEDTLVGVRALAMERYIVPVYSAAGLHIAHGDRSQRKWQEFAANRRVFQSILHTAFAQGEKRWLPQAQRRAIRSFERGDAGNARPDICACLYDIFTTALADPDQRGKYFHTLGRYDEAAVAFAELRGTPAQEAWALFDRGKALRAGRDFVQAITLLKEAVERLPTSPWPYIELALTLAAQDRFLEARRYLEQAQLCDRTNSWVRFLLHRPVASHLQRAKMYVQQGNHDLAVRDYEAALILDPGNTTAYAERAASLVALEQHYVLSAAQLTQPGKRSDGGRYYNASHLSLAQMYLAANELGRAKVVLEETRRLRPHDREVSKYMNEVHSAAAKTYPIPLARDIAQRVQAIPGWFSTAEAELLIALVLRAVASSQSDEPPVLAEVGSYCGRATVAMGLTVLGMGHDDVQIVSVDEPSLGLTSDGRFPRDVLHAQLATYGIENIVIYAPEEDMVPWERTTHLLLIDGRHDYAGVRADTERYTPHLIAGGFLLFHDYADYFPDVQRYVNELLLGSHYKFVAHTESLIALSKQCETS